MATQGYAYATSSYQTARSSWERRRGKPDWWGSSIGDIANSALPYYQRQAGEVLFYKHAARIQKQAARHADLSESGSGMFQPKVKVQLSPLYSTWPRIPAAYAALGATGLLEYQARSNASVIADAAARELVVPRRGDPEAYKLTAQKTSEVVRIRLFLEELAMMQGMGAVEVYRIFLAAQQNRQPETLQDILSAVILYGDLAPLDPESMHESARRIHDAARDQSIPYLRRLPGQIPIRQAVDWVLRVTDAVAPLLPPPPKTQPAPGEASVPGSKPQPGEPNRNALDEAALSKLQFAPINGPRPVLRDHPKTPLEILMQQMQGEGGNIPGGLEDLVTSLAKALHGAAGQASDFRDLRADLVEELIKQSPFAAGPMEGAATEGHEVRAELGDGRAGGGRIFDRCVPPNSDPRQYQKLMQEAAPVIEPLKRNLYPNLEEQPERYRFQTGGSLDPARLAFWRDRETIRRRYRTETKPSDDGRAVFLVACDASASLNPPQMRLAKVLTCAFLTATSHRDMTTLAGLYHSGAVTRGISGPLVEWLHHPRKTPALSRADAVRALAAVPDVGTGAQSDALSLQFMLDEAAALARGSMIYLILISDLAWNVSFHAGMNGAEEVEQVLKGARKGPPPVNVTLVGVGARLLRTGFEDAVDNQLLVSPRELSDYVGLAGKIGEYVAQCVQARRNWAGVQ